MQSYTSNPLLLSIFEPDFRDMLEGWFVSGSFCCCFWWFWLCCFWGVFCQLESHLIFCDSHTPWANDVCFHVFCSVSGGFWLTQNVSQTYQLSLVLTPWSDLQSHLISGLHSEILMLEQSLIYLLVDGWQHWQPAVYYHTELSSPLKE